MGYLPSAASRRATSIFYGVCESQGPSTDGFGRAETGSQKSFRVGSRMGASDATWVSGCTARDRHPGPSRTLMGTHTSSHDTSCATGRRKSMLVGMHGRGCFRAIPLPAHHARPAWSESTTAQARSSQGNMNRDRQRLCESYLLYRSSSPFDCRKAVSCARRIRVRKPAPCRSRRQLTLFAET